MQVVKAIVVFLLLAAVAYAGHNRAQICPNPVPCPGFNAVATATAATTLSYEEEEAQLLSAPQIQKQQKVAQQQPYKPTPAEIEQQKVFWNQLKKGNLITESGHCATSCEWFEIKKGGKVRVKTAAEVKQDQAEKKQNEYICGKCQASWIVYSAPCYEFPNAFIKGDVTGAMAEQVKQQCINQGRCECDRDVIDDKYVRSIKTSVKMDSVKSAVTSVLKTNPTFSLAKVWNSFGNWFSTTKPVAKWTLGLTGWFQTNPILKLATNIWKPKFPFWTKPVSWFKVNKVPTKVWTAVKSAPAWVKSNIAKVSSAAKKISTAAKNAVKSVTSKFGTAAKNTVNKIGAAAKGTVSKIGNFARRFGGFARGIGSRFRGVTGRFARGIGNKFGHARRNAVAKAKEAAKKAVNFARGIGNKFGHARRNAVNNAKQAAQKAAAAAKNAVNNAKQAVSNTAKRAFGGIARAFRGFGGFGRRSSSGSSRSGSSRGGSSRGGSSRK